MQQQAIINSGLTGYGKAGVAGPDDGGDGAVVANGPEAEELRNGVVIKHGRCYAAD